MLKGLSLQDLAAKIEGNKALKRDYIADTDALTMQVQEDKTPVLELPDQGQFPILPLAHEQIGARLDIPRKYYDRMLTERPDLLGHQHQHLVPLQTREAHDPHSRWRHTRFPVEQIPARGE